MRFIYQLILGLIIFNAMLLLFIPYFPNSGTVGNPMDINQDTNFTKYKVGGEQAILTGGGVMGAIMGISIMGGLFGSWAIKSTVPLAASTVGGIVAALYVGPATVLYSLNITNNVLITGIISILGIVIGIMTGFMVLEWLANQQGVH